MYNYKIFEIIKVIDGDTVDAIIDVGFNILIKKRIRLYAINAPETRTKNKKEKQKGLESKKALSAALDMHKGKITIQSHGIGKYGRIIGELFIEGNSVSEFMVSEGFAEKYP